MSDKSKISWTDATWNPLYGCTKISPGCAHCYIARTPPYRMLGLRFEHGRIPIQLLPERLSQPLRWKRPRRIFVNSLSDLFHEDVPDKYIFEVFDVMDRAPQHTFQLLTKRPERMRQWVGAARGKGWPLPNVWLGVTAENQHWLAQRWPYLEATPAAVRFLSLEPLLGPIDLCLAEMNPAKRPQWVIVGGESGGTAGRALVEPCLEPGDHVHIDQDLNTPCTGFETKPAALAWIRSIRDQCVVAGVPFFLKQWGGPRAKSGGWLLDGRTWDEFPEVKP